MEYFNGLTIVISGTFKGHKQVDLKSAITSAEGKVASGVNAKCTHLVISQAEYDKPSPQYIVATKFPDTKVVQVDWLLDSIESDDKLDEAPYLFQLKAIPTPVPEDDVKTQVKKKMATNKRKSDEAATPALKKAKLQEDQKDRQIANSRSLLVPVDQGCPLADSHRVYIDSQGTIYDVTLNQTDAVSNHNKFYRLQLLEGTMMEDFRVWTRWGRVGENGQNLLIKGVEELEDAQKAFRKKFKDKTGYTWEDRADATSPKKGKYTLIERNYDDDLSSDENLPGAENRRISKGSNSSNMSKVESTLPKPVQRLVSLIFNKDYFNETLAEMEYDVNKLPLGKLSKKTLKDGYQALKDLAQHLDESSHNPSKATVEGFSNRYYTLIPHAFGRRHPPVIDSDEAIQREIQLLEALADMDAANDIMKDASAAESASVDPIHQLDRQFAGLGLEEMTPLDISSDEYKELQVYLTKSRGFTHDLRYNLQDIFRIERKDEGERFTSFAKEMVSDRRLLWHGSRCTNFGGILSQGLRIAPPEAPVSGYMFGKGVYLADMSSKSANYCASDTSGQVGLLLLCEAELGRPMLELDHASYIAESEAKEKGCLSTWGLGMTGPVGEWKDAKCIHPTLEGVKMPDFGTQGPGQTGRGVCLQYNEYITYDVAQIRLRYLLRVEMK